MALPEKNMFDFFQFLKNRLKNLQLKITLKLHQKPIMHPVLSCILSHDDQEFTFFFKSKTIITLKLNHSDFPILKFLGVHAILLSSAYKHISSYLSLQQL